MKGLFGAFRSAIILDEKEHRHIRVKMPKDMKFMEKVEIVPLGFSEIIPASLFYPVMFGMQQGDIFPFAVVGAYKRSFYLAEDGSWKVSVIPRMCKVYPFGVFQQGEEFLIVVDEPWISSDGEPIFDDLGNETPFFKGIRKELTELVKDLWKAMEFSQELYKSGCLKSINIDIETDLGSFSFKNVLIANIESLYKIQPEKLYYLNVNGYLPILYAVYYSVRNFELLKFIAKDVFFSKKEEEVPVIKNSKEDLKALYI